MKFTKLHESRFLNSLGNCSLLLERGADVRASDLIGWTVLHSVVEKGQDTYQVVSLLIEKGADVQAKDVHERTALDHTRRSRQNNIVSLLMKTEARLEEARKPNVCSC